MLQDLGFTVRRVLNERKSSTGERAGADLLVATRRPGSDAVKRARDYVGLFGHFDVEEIKKPNEWVTEDPMVPKVVDGRVFCRGVGDNLGPLLLRLIALSQMPTKLAPGLVWFLHGEEEIQSPFALEMYPQLTEETPEVARVALWIEETGYFESDGRQRVMHMHGDGISGPILELLRTSASRFGREPPNIVERYMNKAFGTEGCPCLAHLVRGGTAPYLAIGPNDLRTAIHKPNESVPLDTLAISSSQFLDVLALVAASA